MRLTDRQIARIAEEHDVDVMFRGSTIMLREVLIDRDGNDVGDWIKAPRTVKALRDWLGY